MTVRFAAISMLAAGIALAQTTAQTPAQPAQGTTPGARGGRGPNPNFGRGPGGGRGLNLLGPNAEARLTRQFGLDATQQNTLHTTIMSAQVQQKGMREKEGALHTQLAAAVKSGSESAIDSAAMEIETLHQQQTSIHAKALAAVYSSLTPAQQAKFLPMMNRELGVPGPGRGPGQGPRPRPRGPQQPQTAPQ
jgi:Spy/CpxP family protein refolding chaperone